jgi:hypothetical protein
VIARFLALAWLAGSPGAVGCEAATDEPTPETVTTISSASTTASGGVHDCDALARAADGDMHDAALLPVLCPDRVLSPVQMRGALFAAGSRPAARRLIPLVATQPELRDLARLAAHASVEASGGRRLPDPGSAVVSPVDADVLAHVQVAYATLGREGASMDDRTRADAYLAKVHFQALHQIGQGHANLTLPPFARLLAGRALYHGRRFCTAYWQRRVTGLATLFADTEVHLLALVLALERTPHHGDDALLTIERHRVRRYVIRPGPSDRIVRRLERWPPTLPKPDPDALLPRANEIDRLLDHGLVDLAIGRALDETVGPSSPGIDTARDALVERLREKDLGEHAELLESRVAQRRREKPQAPAVDSTSFHPAAPTPWPTARATADAAAAWLDVASAASGLARRHALGRAVLELDGRPDAVAVLLDRATRGDEGSAPWIPVLLALEDARDRSSLGALRRRHRASAPHRSTRGDDAVRRTMALAMRRADLQPR